MFHNYLFSVPSPCDVSPLKVFFLYRVLFEYIPLLLQHQHVLAMFRGYANTFSCVLFFASSVISSGALMLMDRVLNNFSHVFEIAFM